MRPGSPVSFKRVALFVLYAEVSGGLIRFCFFALLAPFTDLIQNGRKRRVPLEDRGSEHLVIFVIGAFALLVGRADCRVVLHHFAKRTQLDAVCLRNSFEPPGL